MKITRVAAGRADDLRKERDDWDARNNAQKAKHDAQYAEFNKKQREIFDSIRNEVLAALSECKLDLHVVVDSTMSFRNPGVEVRVSSEQNNVHGKDKALSWDWKVQLDDEGNPAPASSSWSGLQATTPTQLESLRQTVKALEILNGIDWVYMLNVTLPDYHSIVTEPSTIGQRPNFDQDIAIAEVEEAIGQNILIKGSPSRSGGRGGAWYKIVSASPKQLKVVEIPAYEFKPEYMEQRGRSSAAEVVESYSSWVDGIAKERFFRDILSRPVETMEY